MTREFKQEEISEFKIIERIIVIRGLKVMLDKDLAEMYGVSTSRLNEAVKRNRNRFPEDFMFQLDNSEFEILISHSAISSSPAIKGSWGGVRKLPYAFTEHGIAMLSSVLRSETAIQVNIQIIRVYTKIRQLLINYKDLWIKLENIEKDIKKKDVDIQTIFEILKTILIQEAKPREPIGFNIPKTKSS